MKKNLKLVAYIILLSNLGYSSEIVHMKNACVNKKMPTACYELGILHEQGLGVNKDIDEAKKYYSKACVLNYQDGCKALEKLKEQ